MPEPDIFSALKAQQWERAKGELRALAALHGSQPAQYAPRTGAHIPNDRWEKCRDAVEDFIKRIEHNGLHE